MNDIERQIVVGYRNLMVIRNEPKWVDTVLSFFPFYTWRHERHAKQYRALQSDMLRYKWDFLSLLVNWKTNGLSEEDVNRLLSIKNSNASVAKEDNLYWVDWYVELRKHMTTLPASTVHSLLWQLKIHDY